MAKLLRESVLSDQGLDSIFNTTVNVNHDPVIKIDDTSINSDEFQSAQEDNELSIGLASPMGDDKTDLLFPAQYLMQDNVLSDTQSNNQSRVLYDPSTPPLQIDNH